MSTDGYQFSQTTTSGYHTSTGTSGVSGIIGGVNPPPIFTESTKTVEPIALKCRFCGKEIVAKYYRVTTVLLPWPEDQESPWTILSCCSECFPKIQMVRVFMEAFADANSPSRIEVDQLYRGKRTVWAKGNWHEKEELCACCRRQLKDTDIRHVVEVEDVIYDPETSREKSIATAIGQICPSCVQGKSFYQVYCRIWTQPLRVDSLGISIGTDTSTRDWSSQTNVVTPSYQVGLLAQGVSV